MEVWVRLVGGMEKWENKKDFNFFPFCLVGSGKVKGWKTVSLYIFIHIPLLKNDIQLKLKNDKQAPKKKITQIYYKKKKSCPKKKKKSCLVKQKNKALSPPRPRKSKD